MPSSQISKQLIMAALRSRCGHYIFVLFLSFFLCLLFSSPNLSGRRVDVCHTSTHGVALVRIENAPQVWSVVHAARWKCRTKKIAKKSPSGHHPTTLSGYIFAIKAMYRQSEKTC